MNSIQNPSEKKKEKKFHSSLLGSFDIFFLHSIEMPIEYFGSVFLDGTSEIPHWDVLKMLALPLVGASALKLWSNGSTNTWERKLHGKVYIITGGTSGIGAQVARELAQRGAQLVLLTSQIGENADPSARTWITDYVDDLRDATNNQLIYSEYCDLNDLHSIRTFATKWLDSKPARRLDGIICCAGECLPYGKMRTNSLDGSETQIQVNYLGHYHLLTLLEPSLRVQPPDRDVRVLVSSCLSQSFGEINLNDLTWEDRKYPNRQPWRVYGTSKLMLSMFAKEFQRRVQSKERPDKQPCGVRINIVNPGIVRSPSTRRFISFGSLFGLLLYLLMYPIYWVFLKSCEMGAQSYIFAINSPDLFNGNGGNYIKECAIVKDSPMVELHDEKLQSDLYDETAKVIERLERQSAIERNKNKPKKETTTKDKKKDKKKPAVAKENIDTEADQIKHQLFKSAFEGDKSMFPDMTKLQENDPEKEIRLRRLDSKFNSSRNNK